ncbi:MAG: 50S ribosomal protein L22 [Nanoarchaeota archaeon]
MVTIKYSFKNFDDHTSKAYGKDLSISTKVAINICDAIRGMDAREAVKYLQDVVYKRRAVPYPRFTDGVGHRKGSMAAGRYPVKAAKTIGKLIVSAMSNASAKGMDDELKIHHICAHKASTPLHQGRQIRRSMKRTHVEVVLREDELKAKRSVKKKQSSTKASQKASEENRGQQSAKDKLTSSQKLDTEQKTPGKSSSDQSDKKSEVSQ